MDVQAPLRSKFHESWGELTAEDVKFTVEQNLKPDSKGGSAPFFKINLDRIEIPDKLTVVLHFKNRVWETPSNFSQFVGYQGIVSKKHLESVGEQKAALHPIGPAPPHVEGRQGDYHRFEALPNHWRKTPAFKEMVIRRVQDPATRISGLRAGEITSPRCTAITWSRPARRVCAFLGAELRLNWIILSGQTTPTARTTARPAPGRAIPTTRRARKRAQGAAGHESGRGQESHHQRALEGHGLGDALLVLLLSFQKGYSSDWKIPPTIRNGPRSSWPRPVTGEASRSG